MQCVEADFSTRNHRERELYTIPISSSWFRWDEIHDVERRSLPEFFECGSYFRSPRVYKEYRDFIISKFREDSTRRLTFTDVRKSLVGDSGSLQKVFLLLEKWGLINFSVHDQNQRESGDDVRSVVTVEGGPLAGVRVVPAESNSSAALSAMDLDKGDEGFRLFLLSSYSDAFAELKPESGSICGFCGDRYRSGLDKLSSGGVAVCPKCSCEDTENGEIQSNLLQNDHSFDAKDQFSSIWTDSETLLLLEAVLKHSDDWDLIAQHVRSKNKMDCISRLIHLPFDEHMLGNIRSKLSDSKAIAPIEEGNKESKEAEKYELPEIAEKDEQQPEIIKEESADICRKGHYLKRRCISFTDATDSLMKQIISLSAICGPRVAAAAEGASKEALCRENRHNGIKSESKCDIEVEEALVNGNKQDAHFPGRSLTAAVAASLGAAGARAKLIADEEEREMERLLASVIQTQLKKVQYKMDELREIALIMEQEFAHVQKMKDCVLEEWFSVLEKIFNAGIPRRGDSEFSKPLLHPY